MCTGIVFTYIEYKTFGVNTYKCEEYITLCYSDKQTVM